MKFYYFPLFLYVLLVFAACSDDSSIALCGCEPDEYCVDDECHATDGSVRPAPLPQNSSTQGE
ncbi:MAG: hypothetical protein KIG72_02445 [Bradymonadales bacterium]|nr:hypothetical protein [Bradymonadales bacterium]